MQILITGGAGFVGSHLGDALLGCGHRVRVLDRLSAQVHGGGVERPSYLHPDVELVQGDVRDRALVRRALRGVDAVYHCAAAVGVGQSMYEVVRYTETNVLGTAVLLEELAARPVARLVVASSMSVYGEGRYVAPDGRVVAGRERSLEQLRRGDWAVRGEDDAELLPVATSEETPPALSSVYALSKFDQERLCLLIGRAYGIPTVALRLFNIYGPRQALSNPYTGVLAIVASRLLNGNRPLVFEDGLQRRDFVHVSDVVQACLLALDAPAAAGCAINIGSGHACTVRQAAERLADLLAAGIEPEVCGRYRAGDIRHCFADISLARRLLGYAPRVPLGEGLRSLAAWLDGQVAHDRVAVASAELAARGLTV